MTRKGSKNFTKSERKLLISIINDYEICDLSEQKMMEILSQKLGRSIKETSYYALKNEAKKSKSSPEQWLDNFCKSGIVEFYKERLEETLLVQKVLLRLYAEEANKKDITTKQDRFLLTKISKAISDNSKNLAELGMSPIILAKLQSLIPKEVINGDPEYVEKYFESMNQDDKILWFGDSTKSKEENISNEETKLDPSKAPTALLPAIDNMNRRKDLKSEATSQGDQPIF